MPPKVRLNGHRAVPVPLVWSRAAALAIEFMVCYQLLSSISRQISSMEC